MASWPPRRRATATSGPRRRYGNFILELDFIAPDKANSGVFIRTGSIKNWINTCMEIQIHATTDGTPHGQCGAVYDCLSPSKDATKKPGEWNHYIITALDNKIYINLNGVDIIDMDLDQWTTPHKNPDGTPNKFPTAYKDMPRSRQPRPAVPRASRCARSRT